MKRLFVILVAAAIVMGLWACSCNSSNNQSEAIVTITEPPTTQAAAPAATTSLTVPASTPAQTPAPDMFEIGVSSDGDAVSDQLEAQVPELSQHEGEHTTVYVDSQSGKTVAEETHAPENHRWQLLSDANGHWRVCALCGETTETKQHSFNSSGRCTVCGYGCEHAFADTVVAPTCTQMGYTKRVCSICGFTSETEFVPAKGHNYKGQVKTPAVCTENGVMEYACTACGDSFTRVIPAHGHTPVVDPGEEATCQAEGKTQGSHCSVCGTVLTAQEPIPVQDHRYENGVCVWCGENEPAGATEPPPSPTPTPSPVSGRTYELPEMPLG